jgi:hypothetical protein
MARREKKSLMDDATKYRVLIFVLDRGFIIVGEAEDHEELAFHWHLKRSRTIRRWGTTKGLSELKDGPLQQTILDSVIERIVPYRSVIDLLVPTEKGRKSWLKSLEAE